MLIKDSQSESGHWYDKNGNPAYEIIGANGKQRNTTLRDAKKLGLLPSVTTVIGAVAKPGLNRWLQEQAILAALTLPRLEGEKVSAARAEHYPVISASGIIFASYFAGIS